MVTFLAGASSNHFTPLVNLLESIRYHEPEAPCIVYDLGLTTDERATLEKRAGIQVLSFPFHLYPDFVRPERKVYSWKPIMISSTLEQHERLLYLDAGNLLHQPVTDIEGIMSREGLYTPASKGTIADWTHPATLRFMQASPDLLTMPNRCGGIIGVTRRANDLITHWRDLCLIPECVCPEGSSRLNHRQDQAVLSVLYYRRRNEPDAPAMSRRIAVSTNNDKLSPAEAKEFFHIPFAQIKAFKQRKTDGNKD